GIPACYGGFETLVENLTKHASPECNYVVYCSSPLYEVQKKTYNNASLKYVNLRANGLQSIPYDIISLFKARKSDVILILGVSGCTILPILKFFTKAKIITNIDGMEWKRNKWSTNVKRFLKLSEWFAVKFSDVVIADNMQITKYVKQCYGVEAKTIAYGGDHVLCVETTNYNDTPSTDEYYLSLCRIEPENNIDMILEAFSGSNKRLKFIGNWEASEYGKNLLSKYSSFSNIEMIKPVYELDELFKLRSNCRAYIHGHSAGGTNPSLVEIMHFAKPVFAFDCTFNRYTTDERAFYFANSVQLLGLLSDAESGVLDDEKCAVNMKLIADELYCWDKIAMKYEDVYFARDSQER
ncbi:TPA: glycosyltransferase family 1 protein, partial [Citrobacter freundii]|nr:glycosyltransferase family 1 protein [Citrobacter freundii]